MKLMTAIVACIGALFIFSATVSVSTPAEAKRYVKDGRYYVKKGNHHYRYYPAGRWLWVGSGLGYGAAAVEDLLRLSYAMAKKRTGPV